MDQKLLPAPTERDGPVLIAPWGIVLTSWPERLPHFLPHRRLLCPRLKFPSRLFEGVIPARAVSGTRRGPMLVFDKWKCSAREGSREKSLTNTSRPAKLLISCKTTFWNCACRIPGPFSIMKKKKLQREILKKIWTFRKKHARKSVMSWNKSKSWRNKKGQRQGCHVILEEQTLGHCHCQRDVWNGFELCWKQNLFFSHLGAWRRSDSWFIEIHSPEKNEQTRSHEV